MDREIINKATGELTTGFEDSDFAGAGPQQNITSNDIMIPKVLMMQQGSPKVLDGDFQFGELVDTLNWEKLGDIKRGDKKAKSLEVVPFHWEKFWVNRKQDGSRWVFESMVKIDHTNENLNAYEEWQGEDKAWRKRIYLHLFYCMVKGKTIPHVVGFRGGSKNAGDGLVTQMFTLNSSIKTKEAWKKSPMAKVMNITPVKTTNKSGETYCALEVSVHRDSSFEEACEALKWFKQISKGSTEVDHSDIKGSDDGS